MDDRDLVPHGSVVQQVARGEVVGAVDDELPAVTEDPVDVLRRQPLLVGDDVDVGIQLFERLARGIRLALAQLGRRVQDLALEVRGVDAVVVDDSDPSNACGREVQRSGRAQAARPDQEDVRLEQALLPRDPDLRDQQVAAVARQLLVVEGAGRPVG